MSATPLLAFSPPTLTPPFTIQRSPWTCHIQFASCFNVVLQALPMLALDAPGLKWTQGVEYFLCEPPRGGVPWANGNAQVAGAGSGRTWFSISESGGVVNLPSDIVEHGVEGIYRRSHCWVMAEHWTAQNPILNSALHEQEAMNAAVIAANGSRTPTLTSWPCRGPYGGRPLRSAEATPAAPGCRTPLCFCTPRIGS